MIPTCLNSIEEVKLPFHKPIDAFSLVRTCNQISWMEGSPGIDFLPVGTLTTASRTDLNGDDSKGSSLVYFNAALLENRLSVSLLVVDKQLTLLSLLVR